MKDELSTSNEQLLTIDAVVLANGEYPASPLPLKILAEAPYVVCCDGGADEYIRRGHTPDHSAYNLKNMFHQKLIAICPNTFVPAWAA